MSVNPIDGNQNFTVVDSLAGQLAKINVADSNIANLIASDVTFQNCMITGGAKSLNGLKVHQISGYAPASLAASSSYFVNKAYGAASAGAASSSNTSVLVLPAGARVVGALLEDPTIDASVACGTQALTGAVASSNTNIADASASAAVNVGAIVGLPNVPTLGDSAESVLTGSFVVANSPVVTGVTVTIGAGFTTSTQLAVTIFYLL